MHNIAIAQNESKKQLCKITNSQIGTSDAHFLLPTGAHQYLKITLPGSKKNYIRYYSAGAEYQIDCRLWQEHTWDFFLKQALHTRANRCLRQKGENDFCSELYC